MGALSNMSGSSNTPHKRRTTTYLKTKLTKFVVIFVDVVQELISRFFEINRLINLGHRNRKSRVIKNIPDHGVISTPESRQQKVRLDV
jgi:hypothetical protein